MRKMIDALHPSAIPAGTTCDIAAAYIDHNDNPLSFAQMVARFPDVDHVKISIRCTVGADVLDVEPSTGVTPQQAVEWTVASRTAGIDPTVYCNKQNPTWGQQAIRSAFVAARVPEPLWWTSNYNGMQIVPLGDSAAQYTDLDPWGHNTYDTSITLDNWPPGGDMSAADVAEINAHIDAAVKIITGQASAFYGDAAHPYSNVNIVSLLKGLSTGNVDVNALSAALVANLGPTLAQQLVAAMGKALSNG